MMKIVTLCFIFFCYKIGYSQNGVMYGVNPQMVAEYASNAAVRINSSYFMENEFEKQQEIYKRINEGMAEVVVIHNNIMKAMTNVNSAFRDARRLKYVPKHFEDINKELKKMIELTIKKPQHAVWLYQYYTRIGTEVVGLYNLLYNSYLKKQEGVLMDATQRNILVSNVISKIVQIKLSIMTVNRLLERSIKFKYIQSIPVFNNWYNRDKMLIEGIINKATRLRNEW